jgi:pimeloyl-ACP methyl ester carboxylesterase
MFALTVLAVNMSVPGLSADRTMPLLGGWAARLDIASHPTVLRLRVSETPSHEYVASVSLDPAPAGIGQLDKIAVTRQGSSWYLRKGDAPNQFRLDISKTGDSFTVTYIIGTTAGRAALRRLSEDVALNKRYTGAYVLPSGQNVYIRTGNYGYGKVLTYLEVESGRTGILFQETADSYTAGPSWALPDPIGLRVSFDTNLPARMMWGVSGKKELIAKKSTAYRREDLQLPVEGGVLGCEALTPTGAGKHPGVVLVPGAGGVDRFQDFYIIADVFAQNGIASLACDKRGTGASTGDWYSQSFQEQAQDVIAGMRYLRERSSEVDSTKVGVWAFSQGTYPGPIAASAGKASFLIVVAEFAIPLREALMLSRAEQMRRTGTSSEEIGHFKEYFPRWQQATLDNDFKAASAVYQACACPDFFRLPPSEEAWNDDRGKFRARLMWPFEPGPVLRRLNMPVLAFWGAGDFEALPSAHRPALEQALREGGNVDYTLRVIDGAGHGLWLDAPVIEQRGYAPEYIRGMLDWLRAKVINKN